MDSDTRNTVDTIKADTRDAVDEAKHRVEAGGEKVKRAVEGDNMPLGERLASNFKELTHDVKADADKVKRESRDEVARDGRDEGI